MSFAVLFQTRFIVEFLGFLIFFIMPANVCFPLVTARDLNIVLWGVFSTFLNFSPHTPETVSQHPILSGVSSSHGSLFLFSVKVSVSFLFPLLFALWNCHSGSNLNILRGCPPQTDLS